MDKVSADERKRQWIWHAKDTDCDGSDNGCLEAACCPCGIYGRTSARLRLALNGQDPTNLPNKSLCSADCFQFALCIPFYGCLIAKLQTTVRSFYDIEGSDCRDWADGCCCPCFTLARNEEEIIIREKQTLKLKGLRDSYLDESSPPSEYRSHVPMAYYHHDNHQASIPSPPRARSATYGGKDTDLDIAVLAPIPELSREVSNVAPGKEAAIMEPSIEASAVVAVPVKAGRQSPEHDTTHSGHGLGKRWPLMQYLDRRWYLVPADKKENDKPKSEDATTKDKSDVSNHRHSLDADARPTSQVAASNAAHGLDDDSKIAPATGKTRFKEHFLDDDVIPVVPVRVATPHGLAIDPILSRVNSPRPHHLEGDTTISTPPVDATEHYLDNDSKMPRVFTPYPHGLEIDPLESTRPKSLWPGKHDIGHDEVAGQRSTRSHVLNEDEHTGDLIKSSSSHHLEADEAPLGGRGHVSAAHRLEDDTPVTGTSIVDIEASGRSQQEEGETAATKLAKAASQLFTGRGK